jgi:hypothetical protein
MVFLRMSHSGTRYNPRMAGAPSPQRPVVLHRLGIIKDPNDAFVQESRTPREPQRDALESFATEAESTPRSAQRLSALRPLAASSIQLVRRHARFAIIGIAAAGLVIGLWAFDEFVGFDLLFARREAPVAAAADTSAATSSVAAVPTPPSGQVQRPRASNANSAGLADGTAQGQQDVRTEGEEAPAAIAAPVPTTLQTGELDAPAETTTVDTPAAPTSVAVVDDTIYSEQDRDVVPPYTSEALPGPTISSWTTRTNAMEVIVSETGAVERVRMVRAPQRMPDTFVLSRAKVWKFTPAIKDGRPVRYRLLLTWEVNP